jgi:hypothetical protein
MREKESRSRVLIEGLPVDDNIRLVAWWYCGLNRNSSAPSEPKVEVCFRTIRKDGSFGSTFFHYNVGITNLGQVRLGSIWRNQKRCGQIDLATETFQVDFSDDGWRFAGPWEKSDDPDDPGWLVTHEHQLSDKARHPKTRVVQFHLTNNPRGLIVPCLEIFSRLYGRSQYVKRVLLTQPFISAYGNLIVPDIEQAPPGTWQVTLDKHCVNGDAPFLAHLRHDSVTQQRTRLIWSQAEAAQNVLGNSQAFPKIGPWFSGQAQLMVRGLWMDAEKRRFLTLQILGCSDPNGVEIYLDRANTNLTGPLEKIKDGTSWPGVRAVSASEINDIQVTHTQEPSGAFNPEEISDDEFFVLGKPRKISRITRETTGNREKPPPIKQAPADKFSGGANHGKGQDVAPATIAAPETTNVDETMIEVWKALKEMCGDSRSLVNEVVSLSYDGKESMDSPKLIALPNPSITHGINPDCIPWLYLDHTTKKHIRGVMLLRVTTTRGVGYIMEVQKRPRLTATGKEQSTGSFQGLAFRSKDDAIFQEWLHTLLKATANTMGVVSKVTTSCPGRSCTFMHISDERGGIPKSVRNGLSGIGLI